jgi:hypothetical protein
MKCNDENGRGQMMLFANKKSPHLAVRAERKIKPEKTLSKKCLVITV